MYIYICICTPHPESHAEALHHRPPRAVRTSSPAQGGPGVDQLRIFCLYIDRCT